MRIQIPYLVTVVVSVLLVVMGHQFAVKDLFAFQNASQEMVKAKVQKIVERLEPNADFLDDVDEDFLPILEKKTLFEAKITSGARKGEIIAASQNFSGFSRVPQKEVSKGNNVLLINSDGVWYFNGYMRINALLGLGILFMLGVLLFGGKKGFNTLLSLGLTCGAIFAVLVPAILSGKNIYVMSVLVCIYTVVMTLLVVIGYNKKSFTAALGCLSSVAVTAIITLMMDKMLFLTGVVDDTSRYLASLPSGTAVNLRAIIFAGIIIGAMGAVEDVATSIASALWEIKEKAEGITFQALFRSGITIGRDIMGSMANTLILAYIGTSLSVVLILSVYNNSLVALFNTEMIVVEILQALAGSLGILFAMPLTAVICSIAYLKDKSAARAAQPSASPSAPQPPPPQQQH